MSNWRHLGRVWWGDLAGRCGSSLAHSSDKVQEVDKWYLLHRGLLECRGTTVTCGPSNHYTTQWLYKTWTSTNTLVDMHTYYVYMYKICRVYYKYGTHTSLIMLQFTILHGVRILCIMYNIQYTIYKGLKEEKHFKIEYQTIDKSTLFWHTAYTCRPSSNVACMCSSRRGLQ